MQDDALYFYLNVSLKHLLQLQNSCENLLGISSVMNLIVVVLFLSILEHRQKPSYFDCYHGIQIPRTSVIMKACSNVAVHFSTADLL